MGDVLRSKSDQRAIFTLSLCVLGLVAWTAGRRDVGRPIAAAPLEGLTMLHVDALVFEANAAQVTPPSPVRALVKPLFARTLTMRRALPRPPHLAVLVIAFTVVTPVAGGVFENLVPFLSISFSGSVDVVLPPLLVASLLSLPHLFSASLFINSLVCQDLLFVLLVDALALRLKVIAVALTKALATRAYFALVFLVETLNARFAPPVETVTASPPVELFDGNEMLAPVAPLHSGLFRRLPGSFLFALALPFGGLLWWTLTVPPSCLSRVLTRAANTMFKTARSDNGNTQVAPAVLTWFCDIVIFSHAVYARIVKGAVRLGRLVAQSFGPSSFYHHLSASGGLIHGL